MDTRFVLLFTGDCACCFHPRLPVFCAVLQLVRHETMVPVGPGKRQGVCEFFITIHTPSNYICLKLHMHVIYMLISHLKSS